MNSTETIVVETSTQISSIEVIENVTTLNIVDSPDNEFIIIERERGPKGDSPIVSRYGMTQVNHLSGILEIDASSSSTFLVIMNANISELSFSNWPDSGLSQRIAIYFQQGPQGNRIVENWGENSLFQEGFPPELTPEEGSIDCVVFDSFDGGNTFFITQVGQNYKRAGE